MIDPGARDCTQIPPEVVPPLAVNASPVFPLEVRVMIEAADLAEAKRHLAVPGDPFARIGIRLKVRYDVVELPAENRSGFFEGLSQREIFEFIKGDYGGERLDGVDLVYFVTHYWTGGFADCIGGVRFPDQAYTFGSIDYKTKGTVRSPTANEGVIAAHELGHLVGSDERTKAAPERRLKNGVEERSGPPSGAVLGRGRA